MDQVKFVEDSHNSMTLLDSLIVTSRNLMFGVILPEKNYYNLTNNNLKFQASVTERCDSLWTILSKSFKSTCEKVNLQKNFTTHELLHKWLLMFPVRFFSPIHRSLFVSYMADIFYIRIYICIISSRYYNS